MVLKGKIINRKSPIRRQNWYADLKVWHAFSSCSRSQYSYLHFVLTSFTADTEVFLIAAKGKNVFIKLVSLHIVKSKDTSGSVA